MQQDLIQNPIPFSSLVNLWAREKQGSTFVAAVLVLTRGQQQNRKSSVGGLYVCAWGLTFVQGGLTLKFKKNFIDLWCFIF